MAKDEGLDPVSMLAEEYRKDLLKLDSFDELVRADFMTYADLKEIEIMANKYDLEEKVTKENVHIVLGGLKSLVLSLLRELAVEDVLERAKEEMTDRVPKKPTEDITEEPESIEDVTEEPKSIKK